MWPVSHGGLRLTTLNPHYHATAVMLSVLHIFELALIGIKARLVLGTYFSPGMESHHFGPCIIGYGFFTLILHKSSGSQQF